MPIRDMLVPFVSRHKLEESPRIVKARGILRHRFWGEYSAAIVLQFESSADAIAAQKQAFTEWDVQTKDASVLQFAGSGAALKKQEALLAKYGADPKKISSLAKSIDHGEPFSISVPIGYTEPTRGPIGPQPKQSSLF